MSRRDNLLFYGDNLFQVLRANLEQAKIDVNQVSESQFKASTDEEIGNHVYSMREIIPLELYEDQKVMETQETQVDVRYDRNRIVSDVSRPALVAGVHVSVNVPFTGDAELWHCQPNSFTMNPPSGRVNAARGADSGTVELSFSAPSDTLDAPKIKQELDNQLSNIRNNIKNSKNNVDTHNQELMNHIGQCVSKRRESLGKHADLIKTLNIPLKQKPSSPSLNSLPIKRKLIKPLPHKASAPAELGIRDEDYEHILNVIRHEGVTFETTPNTFTKLEEEELRNIILAHLNGHYEGDATGETFRGSGKTDIRIEFENRAAFVAECKIWRGQKQVCETVDQVLGYLTWRDCKIALVFFNKEVAGFAELQSKLEEALRGHSLFIKYVNQTHNGEWRLLVRSKDDSERKITLHIFLLNLFAKGRGSQ